MSQESRTRFIAIDAETTGFDPHRDRIVELTVAELHTNLAIRSHWTQRFNPGIPIQPGATEKHGITDEDVADCPPFQVFAPRVQRLVLDAVLIAYNGVRFDIPLLDAELRRAEQGGIAVDQDVIDPYRLFIEDHPRTLTGAVHHYLGRGFPDAHKSLADVQAMLQVLKVQWARRWPLPGGLLDLIHQRDHVWLDQAQKFYRSTEDSMVRFGFGKYRGEAVQHHPGYLAWMTDAGFPEETQSLARRYFAEIMQYKDGGDVAT